MTQKTPQYCSADFVKGLIYGISHDMGAPARHATHFSAMLLAEAEERLTEKDKEWLHFIHEGGLRIQAQIESLLTLSRLETRASPIKPIDINELVREIIKGLESEFPEASIRFTPLPNDQPLPLLIRNQWSKLVEEILRNALLFHPNETTHQVKVNVTLATTASTISLQVRDNGIGISEKNQSHCFVPFKKLNGEKYPGIGMGLTVVKFIAEMQGGTVVIHPSEGNGTEITYTQKADFR